jgi:flagellar biosynthesis/type III secretory pathway M-ring protein FliF/YscJ
MRNKWYQKWWAYLILAIIFLVLGAVIFKEKETVTQQQTEIDNLVRQTKSLDSLYRATAAEKDKIKIIREKIDISKDLRKLEDLIQELEKVKAEKPKNNSVQDLKKYLETEF